MCCALPRTRHTQVLLDWTLAWGADSGWGLSPMEAIRVAGGRFRFWACGCPGEVVPLTPFLTTEGVWPLSLPLGRADQPSVGVFLVLLPGPFRPLGRTQIDIPGLAWEGCEAVNFSHRRSASWFFFLCWEWNSGPCPQPSSCFLKLFLLVCVRIT